MREPQPTAEIMLSLTGIKSSFLSPLSTLSRPQLAVTCAVNHPRWDGRSGPVLPPSWWSGPLVKQIQHQHIFGSIFQTREWAFFAFLVLNVM